MREHQFIHAYTNEMSEDTSIYDGFKDLMNVFEYATKVDFKNKTILCNCDDPRVSNFFHSRVKINNKN